MQVFGLDEGNSKEEGSVLQTFDNAYLPPKSRLIPVKQMLLHSGNNSQVKEEIDIS